MELLYRIAADLVMTLHALYVLVVAAGFAAIVAGIITGWQWVRNPWFRYVHLAMILLVVAEVWCGVTCPLTTWERQLREWGGETADQRTFVANFVHEWLFYDLPGWVFNAVYTTFGLLVLLTLILAPPRSIRSSESMAKVRDG